MGKQQVNRRAAVSTAGIRKNAIPKETGSAAMGKSTARKCRKSEPVRRDETLVETVLRALNLLEPVSGSSASRRPSARKRAVRRPAFSQAGESAKGEEFLLVLELFRGLECLYVAPAKTRGSCTAVLGGPDRSRHGSPDFDYKTRRR